MRLSNTLMMNESLLPTGKKAFTLAEVLITLSILGVVAALTIPSLVNRQSDLAAQVKLKKAIANFENVAAVYMVENEETNLASLVANNCENIGSYFKIVEQNSCTFTTADGVFWAFSTAGNPLVFDSETSPRYAVSMWAKGGEVNGTGDADGNNNSGESVRPEEDEVLAGINNADGEAIAPLKGYFAPGTFLNAKASDLSKDKGSNGSATCGKAAAGATS